jgi:hypothetical protein
VTDDGRYVVDSEEYDRQQRAAEMRALEERLRAELEQMPQAPPRGASEAHFRRYLADDLEPYYRAKGRSIEAIALRVRDATRLRLLEQKMRKVKRELTEHDRDQVEAALKERMRRWWRKHERNETKHPP